MAAIALGLPRGIPGSVGVGLKPWNLPVFMGPDLQYWTLWAVAPKSGLVALFEQPDGSLAVDEVTSAMERLDIDYQAHESRPGVGAIFARTPKKRQAEVTFHRTSLGFDQVINGPSDIANLECDPPIDVPQISDN